MMKCDMGLAFLWGFLARQHIEPYITYVGIVIMLMIHIIPHSSAVRATKEKRLTTVYVLHAIRAKAHRWLIETFTSRNIFFIALMHGEENMFVKLCRDMWVTVTIEYCLNFVPGCEDIKEIRVIFLYAQTAISTFPVHPTLFSIPFFASSRRIFSSLGFIRSALSLIRRD